MGRIRSLLKRIIKPEPPARPRTPPVFVPDPAAEGLETRPAELLKRIAEGEAVVFVDVRAGNERDVFIPDAVHMRVGEVSSRWDELDPEKTPIFYCATGGQSINAAEVMRERGGKTATCILGGLPAWEDAGGAVGRLE
ncbi:MAG: rhodanese-related sulfurtransferase [Myxococcota bacterium]|jgi:rhodanese-related sulfurtransferase